VLCIGPDAAADTPSFTREQAVAGRDAYRQSCAACHGARLEGRDIAPSLTGSRFDQMWRGYSLDVLMFHLKRMPQQPAGEPGSLGDEAYANILAYLLLMNGVETAETPLPSDKEALAALKLPRAEGTEFDPDAPAIPSPEDSERLTGLSTVSDDMLKNPPAGDWLQWGRTYDATNYSPLDIINTDNAKDITSAWRATLRPGTSMPTPLVHDGVMFLQTFPDTTLALDGATGKVLWRYQYKPKYGSSQKLGLAIHGDNVFVPTSDLHVIALKSKTGELAWDHEIAIDNPESLRGRYNLRSAPLVVGDMVIQGVTASFVPKGGFIVAIDSKTGKEAWRFNTIARPGEPYGDSWNGLPLDKRSGGSVWHIGTYDPELNLVYFGVAPTYDTGPLLHPIDDDTVSSEAMYTNCTIALNPQTGELVWHYQHMANDQWDLDWVFERQIVEMPVDGEPRKVVMNAGKMAIVEALDAETGEYLFSIDPGVQNVVTAIDPVTGAKTVDPEKLPDPDRPCVVCPIADGARAWQATSYSPRTNLLYMPLFEWCMKMGEEGIRLLTSGVGLSGAPHPDAEDGMISRLQAIDVANQKLSWVRDLPAPMTTSALATAGGVVFVGDMEPSLKAIDDTTGEILWQAPLDQMPSCNLITYSMDARQYVAVIVGFTNNHVRDLTRWYTEYRTSRGEPVPDPAGSGAAIWVFAL
jgi:alcohol dehydrogenase (cytochrome c)